MNWDQIQGQWKQYKGSAKQQWGKLTDDDMDRIDGNKDILTLAAAGSAFVPAH